MAFTYQNSLMSQLPMRTVANRNDDDDDPAEIIDYSVIALLPVVLVALLIVGVFFVYRYRRWRLNKKQLEQLNAFYETVESSPCLQGKPIRLQHSCTNPMLNCEKVSKAVCVPQESSPFFQPSASARTKPLRTFEQAHKPVSASEVIFHFTQLRTNSRPKKSPLVHRV